MGPHHIDRADAVAGRLGDRFEVTVVEVASRSQEYAQQESADSVAAAKVTLFPGRSWDHVGRARRFAAMVHAIGGAKWCFVGVPSENDIIALSWALPVIGTRTVLMNDSKLDDRPRRTWFETLKALTYLPYRGAIVSGSRAGEFLRFLGFARRPVLPGYDTVAVDRVVAQAGGRLAAEGDGFSARPFVFVGRMIGEKNLPVLIRAYARYRQLAGENARKLVLTGSGPEQPAVEQLVSDLGLTDHVMLAGYLGSEQVARQLSDALALLLPSVSETWGLVVNEAIACGLPVIVSEVAGARDLLVDNLINGFVVPPLSVEGWARAMLAMGADEARWKEMARASEQRRWFADAERFADAVETMIYGASSPSWDAVQRMERALRSREI